ncbi:MAG: hypothetical protein KTR24_16070, partial [Saprospiraceae bacterium]|nr:hypothetical protein [Saprospiraceae bacterium]
MYRTFALFLLMGLTNHVSAQLAQIDSIRLTFTASDSSQFSVRASMSNDTTFMPSEAINLAESTEYSVNVSFLDNGVDLQDSIVGLGESLRLFLDAGPDLLASEPVPTDLDTNGLAIGVEHTITSNCVDDGNISSTFRLALVQFPMKDSSVIEQDGSKILEVIWEAFVQDDPNAPPCENEEEVIDRVTLTFTPTAGGDTIIAVASDPDGPGPLDLQVQDINLNESTDYTLSITLENTIEGEDITEEIIEEDDEHLFLFSFSEGIFEDPEGDGNVDNRQDPVNYDDQDENGLPVGLRTSWATACTEDGNPSGNLQIVLKHQPDIKSATSGIDDGGTDVDITWTVNIVDDPDAPPCENEEEVIDRVTLTFTPTSGGDTIVAVASDPDGPGPLDLEVEDINLNESTAYTLSISLENTIEGEDITEEIMEEDDEHLFLFA